MRTERRRASPTGVAKMASEGDLKFPGLPEHLLRCPMPVWMYVAGAPSGVESQSWQTSATGYFFKCQEREAGDLEWDLWEHQP